MRQSVEGKRGKGKRPAKPYEPTEEEIAKELKKIQEGWTDRDFLKRAGMNPDGDEVLPPEASTRGVGKGFDEDDE